MFFFISYILIVNLIFLNLFIAIILQGYVDTSKEQEQEFNLNTVYAFMGAWQRFDPLATGFIRKESLDPLLE